MTSLWPFPDAPTTAVLTTAAVMRGATIVYVLHESDGGWQFLDGRCVHPATARIVELGELVRGDATLAEVGGLPRGWHAGRVARTPRWEVGPDGLLLIDPE